VHYFDLLVYDTEPWYFGNISRADCERQLSTVSVTLINYYLNGTNFRGCLA